VNARAAVLSFFVAAIATSSARADLLPADEMPIPRLVQLRGVERLAGVVVIQNCYPQRSAADSVALPYCVIRDAKPFVASGRLYFAPDGALELRARTATAADASAVERLRADPVFIESPRVNLVDPDAFFKDAGLTKTDADFGIRDHVAVKLSTRLARVTEIYDVDASDAGLSLRPVRVEWTCQSGAHIAGPAPLGPNQLPPAPNCEPPDAAATTAPPPAGAGPSAGDGDAGPTRNGRQIGTILLAAVVLGLIAFVILKKR
jgi:hypothetical protein